MEMFLEITFNFGMLVSVSIIGGFIIQRVKNRYLQSVFQGFLFGLAAVVGILHPVVVNKGLIFDGRSVMISLAGLFYGPIAAVISATGAGILRVFQGGAGVYMGTAVIVSSAIIGLICHYMWQKEKLTIKKILIMSIDVHIAMLACTVFLPDDIRYSVLSKIWISVLTVYPLSSLLIGKMLLMASDHWRMKKQLEESERKFRSYVECAPNGIFVTNERGDYIDVNSAAEKITGYSKDELLSMNIVDLIPEEKQDKALKHFRRAKAGHNVALEIPFVKKGSTNMHYWMVDATKISEGKYLGFVSDTTKRKNDEKELKKAKQEAEEANSVKSSFLANMSHELKTPLNAIYGVSQILSSELKRSEYDEYLQLLNNASKNMVDLVSDLLDLSRIDEGKLKILMKRVSLDSLLNTTIAMFQKQAKEKGVDLRFSCDSNVPKYVITDPLRVQQILFNFLSNAIKFTSQGSVTLSVAARTINENRARISFLVSDTGVGIEPEMLDSVFDRFKQLDMSLTKNFQGTGLGLAISKEIAELLDGQISVDSVLGKGSVFTFSGEFELSKQMEKDSSKIEKHNDMVVETRSGKILFAEDNEDSCWLFQKLIEDFYPNITCHIAKNGRKAVEMTEQLNPHIIFMDIQMPKMNGFEATRILRDKGINIPIIAQTAFGSQDVVDECKEAGLDDFICKPIELHKLAEIIETYMKLE